jgi:hypothetical protein
MHISYRWVAALLLCTQLSVAHAQQAQNRPGLQPYIPNRIEWLGLVLNSQLRQDAAIESPFSLNVVNSDHETILIFVRYQANVDREIMNMAVDTAREVIQITAKSYGWDRWVKIKERIELAKPRTDRERK